MTDRQLREAMAQYYIAPAITEGSHYYRMFLTYNPTIQMANMHAYKTVYALREISEETMYYPHDIMTHESSAALIVKNGFFILLRTREKEERIRQIIKPGYDLERVDIEEISADEFKKGFHNTSPDSRMHQIVDAINEENVSYAPGDFVISDRKPGKAVRLAKDRPQQAYAGVRGVENAKVEQLNELVRRLLAAQTAVVRSEDLVAQGMALEEFHKAVRQMNRITAELQIAVNRLNE